MQIPKFEIFKAPRHAKSPEEWWNIKFTIFFQKYFYHINMPDILPNGTWNLDEAGIKFSQLANGFEALVPDVAPHIISHDSSKPAKVLEIAPKTGQCGNPLLTYKGIHQIKTGFPIV